MKLISLLVTPPADRGRDHDMVRAFLDRPGKKIICGGSTVGMVESFLGRETDINPAEAFDGLPPAGELEGVDLVTEGGITLGRVLDLLREGYTPGRVNTPRSAAERVADMLFNAEAVEIFHGSAVHGGDAPVPDKKALVGRLADQLTALGKKVTVYNY